MTEERLQVARPGSPLSALLVEGSGVARDILGRVLSHSLRHPLVVQAVTTPQDAPAELGGFGIALVDIDLDGDAAASVLRRLPRHCWRLATTLYDDEERLLGALDAGIHGYLLKQDRYERQVEVLQRVVNHRPEVSPTLARTLAERLRLDPRVNEALLKVLGDLGRGLSLRETARELGRPLADVESLMALVYRLAAGHATLGARGHAGGDRG